MAIPRRVICLAARQNTDRVRFLAGRDSHHPRRVSDHVGAAAFASKAPACLTRAAEYRLSGALLKHPSASRNDGTADVRLKIHE
jgi:hypothetical protein